MTTFPPQGRAQVLDEFVHDLRLFTNACGSPKQRELVRLAPAVIADHRKRIPLLRPLTLTVVSDVMARRRQGPPDWGWVATYVLTCLEHVSSTGIKLRFDGPCDLQGWHTRYQAMRDRLAQLPAGQTTPGEPASSKSAEQPGPPQAQRPPPAEEPAMAVAAIDQPSDAAQYRPAGDPSGPVPGRAPSRAPDRPDALGWPEAMSLSEAALAQGLPDQTLRQWERIMRNSQSMTHRRYQDMLGEHGVDLLIAAEHGDIDAACRLGILLLCLGHPSEAKAWLTAAAEAGEEAAKVLINAAPSQVKQMAAELAYEFTLPGYDQALLPLPTPYDPDAPAPTGAEIYYRAATTAGHPGATVRMGQIYEARGEYIPALHTYLQAARRGHPDGPRHFTRLNDYLATQDLKDLWP